MKYRFAWGVRPACVHASIRGARGTRGIQGQRQEQDAVRLAQSLYRYYDYAVRTLQPLAASTQGVCWDE